MRGQVCEAATRSRWCARRRARWRRAACATRAARLGCCWLTRATLARRSTPRPWRGRSLACRSIHTPSTPSARTYVPCTGAHSTGLAHVGVAQARGAAGAARAVRARGRAARLLRVALPERPARLGATACLGAGALLALLLSSILRRRRRCRGPDGARIACKACSSCRRRWSTSLARRTDVACWSSASARAACCCRACVSSRSSLASALTSRPRRLSLHEPTPSSWASRIVCSCSKGTTARARTRSLAASVCLAPAPHQHDLLPLLLPFY